MLHVYLAEFDHSSSNCIGMGRRLPLGIDDAHFFPRVLLHQIWSLKVNHYELNYGDPLFKKSLKIIETDADRSATCDFV